MYVVWKKRELRGNRTCEMCGARWHAGRFALIPLLVESRRIGGKPHQAHVARLASVRNCCLRSEPVLRAWWDRVDASLEALRRADALSQATAHEIRHKLSEGLARAKAEAGTGDKQRQAGTGAGTRAPGHLAHPLRVLGLAWPCQTNEVKSAFRARAKQTHPDTGGRTEDFRAVYEAYSRLREALAGPLR